MIRPQRQRLAAAVLGTGKVAQAALDYAETYPVVDVVRSQLAKLITGGFRLGQAVAGKVCPDFGLQGCN
jgi:hypothetical protein